MKKITFSLLTILITSFSYSQTYTTGLVEFINDGDYFYSAQIDVNPSLVTLTLNGPDNKYLGLGFDNMSMTSGGDVVIWLNDGTFKLTDRSFLGIGAEPVLDAQQDWTIVSNTTTDGQRNIVATRLPDTGNPDDYVFSTTATSIDLVWSFEASSTYSLGWHGDTRGATRQSFVLGTSNFNMPDLTVYPNPGKTRLNINLSVLDKATTIEVYDILGNKTYANTLNSLTNSINVSNWHSGVYLVRISQDNQVVTKRFVKQ
ncbi:T9SS type A sorting domain-containing protein [Xanthomarina sp. F2636L]|uniref:T9SS type A sorting domain-containing protein n=1 Tax=Xanthomarina sp. F2636L TaxID=2996018 RepID=UPI00225E5EC8|nr:T9SS type A sorting domain-containing protein [Xanthomarina sp. F2636L]MCX7550186.1 T9SS type A sorting domain-containing protein [Xanthomarina sp. F2636L]